MAPQAGLPSPPVGGSHSPAREHSPVVSETPDLESGCAAAWSGNLANVLASTDLSILICDMGLITILLPCDSCQEYLGEFWVIWEVGPRGMVS